MKILYVCEYNQGRSPIAEYLHRRINPKDEVKSAGINLKASGDTIPKVIWDIMNEIGVDLSNHRTGNLNPLMVQNADRIFVLCEKEKCPVFLTDSPKAVYIKTKDPYHKSKEELREIRKSIETLVKSLI